MEISCTTCKHLKDNLTCDAFPHRIPMNFIAGQPHVQVMPGQANNDIWQDKQKTNNFSNLKVPKTLSEYLFPKNRYKFFGIDNDDVLIQIGDDNGDPLLMFASNGKTIFLHELLNFSQGGVVIFK